MRVEVKTQADFDAAVSAGNVAVCTSGRFEAYGSASVRASGSASVVAYDSASVVAYGFVALRLFGGLTIRAAASVVVMIHRAAQSIEGGQQIECKNPVTPAGWCEHWGVTVDGEMALLYKGVGGDYHSPHGGDYTPGTVPVADDWDGGGRECGGGFHFSPTPHMTREFNPDATKYVACPVALEDIAVHPDGDYPQKVKARGCCAPVWECDIDGNKVEG